MPTDGSGFPGGFKNPVLDVSCNDGATRVLDGTEYDVPDQVSLKSLRHAHSSHKPAFYLYANRQSKLVLILLYNITHIFSKYNQSGRSGDHMEFEQHEFKSEPLQDFVRHPELPQYNRECQGEIWPVCVLCQHLIQFHGKDPHSEICVSVRSEPDRNKSCSQHENVNIRS